MFVSVSGDKSFERFAVACEKAAGPEFDKRMDRGLKEAGDDLGRAVLTSTEIYMPSGYDETFRNRAMAKTEIGRGARRGVTVIVYAKGRTGRRKVEALERGELRHPNWGRTRVLKAGGRYAKKPENIRGGVYVNPWSVTRIRAGFFSEPIHYAAPRAMKRLDVAVSDIVEEIGKAS